MAKKIFIFILYLSIGVIGFEPVSVHADKIVLKEGKTIHGKITEETGTEYRMRLKSNMYLRIEKSKVRQVYRTQKPAKDPGNVITYDSLKDVPPSVEKDAAAENSASKKPSSKTTKETKSEKLQKKADPPAPAPDPGTIIRVNKKRNITFYETLAKKTYAVSGGDIEKIMDEIYDRDRGKGFQEQYYRGASRVSMESSWGGAAKKEGSKFRWAEVIIRATMTVTSPEWKNIKSAKENELGKWNSFKAELEEHDNGHLDIYLNALMKLGDKINALRQTTEEKLNERAEKLFSSAMERVEKQQAGYDRRHRIKPANFK